MIVRKSSNGTYGCYIRLSNQQQVCEVNTAVTIKSKLELDDKTKLPLDENKKQAVETALEELKSFYHELKRKGQHYFPSDIKQAFKGRKTQSDQFIALFDEFMQHQETEVAGGNLKPGTMKNYFITQKYLKQFVRDTFKRKDIPLELFDRMLLDKFYYWLVGNTNSSNNGRAKHFERVKRFTTVMSSYGKIKKDPFTGFKINKTPKARVFLSEKEVCALRSLELTSEGLQITRDMFLLMCNTGLAYSDLRGLSSNQIEKDHNGAIIRGTRQKTDTSFIIPLTQEAEELLEKYTNHPHALKNGYYLPVFTNQIFNRYLKQLAKKAGIQKHLSSHVARHTFATTALTSGVPLVTIQRVLGHSDIRMTQHYSRLVDKKLMDDMQFFKQQMKNQTEDRKNINPGPAKLRILKPIKHEKPNFDQKGHA